MNDLPSLVEILYQNQHILIIQTRTGQFDKWQKNDIYGQFNLGLHVGDDSVSVLKNRADLLSGLRHLTKHNIQSIFWLNQIHSNHVCCVDDGFLCDNQDADALVSHQKNQALAIMTADCVPIAIFDDKDGIACIHAGWQGLTNGVIKQAVAQLQGQVKAVIGACISQKNYEIDIALADKIIQTVIKNQLVDLSYEALYHAVIQKHTHNLEKCYIDIVKLTCLQLEFLSVECMNNEVLCSYEQSNLYSYRVQTHAQKPATGRMAMVIVRY